VKRIEIPAPDFDLAMTLDSGQVFHWERAGNGFAGTIDALPVYVEQRAQVLIVRASKLDRLNRSSSRGGCPEANSSTVRTVAHYFALDHPLAEICASFPDDPVMNAACEFCRGLRIIRQPKWECLATFLCSSMKQVAHIRQISRKLRERFGDAREIAGQMVCTFPAAERIAASSEKELRQCGLGYRAPNLLKTARLVATDAVDLEQMSILPDVDLRARLCELPGIGAKVANCVMLFAYERLRAFPIDVWIERVLRQHYFPRARKLRPARLRRFSEKYFGAHGGYAQQYLFHHARLTGGRRAVGARKVGHDSACPSRSKVVTARRLR
jgi:N-glycosylase/DNA lyase